MTAPAGRCQVSVYSVTPPSVPDGDAPRPALHERLTATARASEEAGWAGILVPHNLQEIDPWVVASFLGCVTTTLTPLIALQPTSLPPHTAASCAAGFAMIYGRPLHFNLVAGAREDEQKSVGDRLGHDERYDRLLRYARILTALLRGEVVDESDGPYPYRRFRLEPRPAVLEDCKMFVAGSSAAGLAVAEAVADVMVTHPAPVDAWQKDVVGPLRARGFSGDLAVRLGVLCRPDGETAWQAARERFPHSWLGDQQTLLKTRSSNAWARELAQRAVAEGEDTVEGREVYWLGAFRSGLASSPFLVGSYQEVAAELRRYLSGGVRHVLLNGGLDEDFEHTRRALDLAVAGGLP